MIKIKHILILSFFFTKAFCQKAEEKKLIALLNDYELTNSFENDLEESIRIEKSDSLYKAFDNVSRPKIGLH
jgi:hypothetical protein